MKCPKCQADMIQAKDSWLCMNCGHLETGEAIPTPTVNAKTKVPVTLVKPVEAAPVPAPAPVIPPRKELPTPSPEPEPRESVPVESPTMSKFPPSASSLHPAGPAVIPETEEAPVEPEAPVAEPEPAPEPAPAPTPEPAKDVEPERIADDLPDSVVPPAPTSDLKVVQPATHPGSSPHSHRLLIGLIIAFLIAAGAVAFYVFFLSSNTSPLTKSNDTADTANTEITPEPSATPSQSSVDATRKRDIRSIQVALEEYFSKNVEYPASLDQLASGAEPTMSVVPKDPKNVSPYLYIYKVSSDKQSFELTACLDNATDAQSGTVAPIAPCTTRTFKAVSLD